ncbi:ornithine cyclodeaminase family protein [Humibacillus xanthopallidus]|uniref:Ornithine cyclodeaminase n=1 Tax=Humibacillus xanthopallidus TaxID=412689 RepID=A0A543I3J1_9MICO|nr:ornithine cyclodeaminase family protein [Humibacillus xanthopallidus]TQM65040.1 ornithine cyclodeaminase [Humibacillus xanthopallidus]
MTEQPRWVDATTLRRAVSADRARRLIRQALVDGLDPAAEPARTALPAGDGQLLVMPSTSRRAAGVKVATVAPANPSKGLERIQAIYVLCDAVTLTPSTLLDGAALTTLRTPAVSAVAIDCLAPQEVSQVVILGSGPQAIGHAEAVLAIRAPQTITVAGRALDRARSAANRIRGLDGAPRVEALAVTDRQALEEAVRGADVIITATAAQTPVLDGSWVRNGACVVAIGSHELDRRELDSGLMGRSLVVVEDVETARREAGDVVLAVSDGALSWSDVGTLTDLVRGHVSRATDRPNVFKGVGMAWQDLVVAEHATRL